MTPQPDLAPVSVGELLRRYPLGSRITGWDPMNPPEVERAFRAGYLIGAERCAHIDFEDAAAFENRIHTRRGDIYYGESNVGFDRWSDRRAALLRGATQGAVEMVRARAEGVKDGLYAWLNALRRWASETPPCLDWSSARPPDYPEPDSPPLGRDGIPKSQWGSVFGMWAMFEPQPNLPARQRGPFIETKEQYEKLQAKARQLGNIERLLHPDPAAAAASQAERWPEPKTIAEFDCPESLDWIWQGWVAVAHITALVAKWKAGKTTLLHHLLCARERGGDIAGAITPGLTLVISEEHPTLWRMRSANKVIAGHVRFICLPLVTSMQDWLDFTAHVVKLVVRDSYSLVVYDTLPGLAPIQDENANSQMLAFLRPLLRLKDAGTGTLLITHPPKGHTGDDFNVRGASALMGFADQLVALKRPEGDSESTQRILKCIGRLGEPLEQTIELRDGEYITLGTKLNIERAKRRATMRGILPEEPPGLTIEEMIARWPADRKAPTARTLRRHLADWLNKDGSGTKDDPVRYWW